MILFSVLYLIFWCHYFLLPRQASNFCGLDKSTIPPVYLQLSTMLYWPSWAAVHNTFFLSAFSLPLYIFFRWSRSVTTTVNKSQWRQAFACRWSVARAFPPAKLLNWIFVSQRRTFYVKWSKTLEHLNWSKFFLYFYHCKGIFDFSGK